MQIRSKISLICFQHGKELFIISYSVLSGKLFQKIFRRAAVHKIFSKFDKAGASEIFIENIFCVCTFPGEREDGKHLIPVFFHGFAEELDDVPVA